MVGVMVEVSPTHIQWCYDKNAQFEDERCRQPDEGALLKRLPFDPEPRDRSLP